MSFEHFERLQLEISSDGFVDDSLHAIKALQSLRANQRAARDLRSRSGIRRVLGFFTGANQRLSDIKDRFLEESVESAIIATCQLGSRFVGLQDSVEQIEVVVKEQGKSILELRKDLNDALSAFQSRLRNVNGRLERLEIFRDWTTGQIMLLSEERKITVWHTLAKQRLGGFLGFTRLLKIVDSFLDSKANFHNLDDIDHLRNIVVLELPASFRIEAQFLNVNLIDFQAYKYLFNRMMIQRPRVWGKRSADLATDSQRRCF